jgi:hypothetical protein
MLSGLGPFVVLPLLEAEISNGYIDISLTVDSHCYIDNQGRAYNYMGLAVDIF